MVAIRLATINTHRCRTPLGTNPILLGVHWSRHRCVWIRRCQSGQICSCQSGWICRFWSGRIWRCRSGRICRRRSSGRAYRSPPRSRLLGQTHAVEWCPRLSVVVTKTPPQWQKRGRSPRISKLCVKSSNKSKTSQQTTTWIACSRIWKNSLPHPFWCGKGEA